MCNSPAAPGSLQEISRQTLAEPTTHAQPEILPWPLQAHKPTPLSGCLPTCLHWRRRMRRRGGRGKRGGGGGGKDRERRSVCLVDSELSPGQNPGQGVARSQKPKKKRSKSIEWGSTPLLCLLPSCHGVHIISLLGSSPPSLTHTHTHTHATARGVLRKVKPRQSLPLLNLPWLPSAG